MYWRIRKIGPEQIAKQYGVHAILIVSVLFNLVLFTRVNAAKGMTGAQTLDYDRFCRQVTNHLFDANYVTVVDSMKALEGELTKLASDRMKQMGLIPPTTDELRAISRQMDDSKSVSCVKFDEVTVGQPDTKTNFLPVDCKIHVVVHDSQGVKPSAFNIRYFVGLVMNKKTGASYPIVIDCSITEARSNPQ